MPWPWQRKADVWAADERTQQVVNRLEGVADRMETLARVLQAQLDEEGNHDDPD